ncbi:APC membrane recruitment protein 2-like [Xyrauchen texanus]|uniref:APC membrane recruitment protein 2-like n=1 Tax=Xyrauchen texanus TaxID=154827 RepID=UPI00224199BF|nr:APC membrane recruitment protein 2-like [Xyrauchen texanus]
MEVQTECSEPPPCDPQPTGKLNKTAFKLFGRRKSGSSMQSIFSVRNKGEATGKATSKPQELVRSKTHDGLITDTPSELDGHRKEESASADQLQAGMPDGVSSAPLRSSITRSFSFFSLLRRSSSRAGDGVSTVGRRGRGLKGLFSSMRWRRKPQAHEDSGGVQEVAKEVKEGDPILSPDSMKTEKEDITLTLEPLLQVFEDSPLPGDAGTWKGTSMQELQGTNEVECGRHFVPLSSQHIVTEESPALPLRVQAGGLQHDKHSDSAHLSSIPTCALTPPMEHSTADPPSEQSVDRLCSLFTDVTSLKSFDSLTGCGDIIADPEEDSGNGGSATSSGMGCSSGGCMGRRLSGAGTNSERCSPAKPPLPPQVSSLASIQASCYMSAHQRARPATKKPQGSGVVAYMGGGEEMASPEGVDDEDMQGMWHMLPQKGEDSPAPLCAEPVLHHVQTRLEKRPPPVKGLQGLSKIPGSCKIGKQQPICPSLPPVDKELQDAPPSDEGYWDSPTPGPDDEDSGFHRRDGLLRDSCSGDALYDLYDPDSPSAVGSDDDVSSPTKSAGDLKISLPSKKCSSFSTSSFRSMKGSTSLPRDSKIPISVRQTPPSHSSSQGALSSNLSPTSKSPSNKTDAPPRTRIPVSKLPVRRSGNKSSPSKQSRK